MLYKPFIKQLFATTIASSEPIRVRENVQSPLSLLCSLRQQL